ncbi:MAG TPA: hypothetical protein VEK07_24700 [Polyangiaceae bacterium]|nr:hypothetical protein [Polyangiaceae bacterium]
MRILPQGGEDEAPTWSPRSRRRSEAATRSAASPVGLFALDSPRATLLYWGSVALVVTGLFATRLLPCVDYPQHLALSDVARRLQAPHAPEAATYELNFLTYNGLFHLVVAWLSNALPIELAGRVVLAASLVAMAAACLALVRVLGRPPEHAALFVPVLFSFSLGWGFANYVLATAIVAWTLVLVARATLRPSLASVAAITALGLLCAFAHVLAMLVLCVMAAALALEVAWRHATGDYGRRVAGTLLRAAIVLLPLAIGCAYCVAVYRRQYVWDPGMYRDPTIEGTAPPFWQKVVMFGAFALDLFDDATDQVILWVVIGVMACAVFWRRQEARAGAVSPERPAPIVAPFALMTIAYFCTPMVCIGTHLIFPRLGQWLIFGAVLAMPRFPARMVARARRYVLGLGVVAGVDVFLHCALFGWETSDASAVIDELPAARAATAVIWEPWTHAFRNGTLTHLAAYYAARKHGQWAFAFARYLSVPVRFKPNSQPAWPARGWEFDAEAYDPRCKYARAFPLVIVKAPEGVPRDATGEPIVRKLVFKGDADTVRLLSHHGRFWAFDTTGLPEDGSL